MLMEYSPSHKRAQRKHENEKNNTHGILEYKNNSARIVHKLKSQRTTVKSIVDVSREIITVWQLLPLYSN